MSKAADTEIGAMGHLATEVDRCRPIDRQRVAELVLAGAELHERFGTEGTARITAWLITRATVDTDDARHQAELRAKAKAEGGANVPPADPPAPDPAVPLGLTGHPLASCDEVGHSRCELVPDPEGLAEATILHHPADAAGA